MSVVRSYSEAGSLYSVHMVTFETVVLNLDFSDY